MAKTLGRIATTYNYFLHEIDDADTRSWFMVQSPLPLVAVIVTYLTFVKRIGPSIMAKRPPYSLKKAIAVINILQILANLWLALQCGRFMLKDFGMICKGVRERGKSSTEVLMASTMWVYYMIKFADLADTVLFVLRKKNNQVSFLHLYHHVITLTNSWLCLKYYPGGASIPIQLLNSMVHVLMFTYYFLAGMGPKMTPYLWWKKYLTAIQIVQLFTMLAITVSIMAFGCKYNKFLFYFNLYLFTTVLILFINFYTKSYNKAKKK